MSTPLKTQLRDYFGYLDEEQEAVDLAAVQRVAASSYQFQERSEDEPVMVELRTQKPAVANRNWLTIAAAVLVIAGIGFAAFFVTQSDDAEAPAEVRTFGEESAQASVDEYFAAYATGDADSLLALFTPDATFRDTFGGPAAREDWALGMVWDLAQGTSLTPPECTVSRATLGEAVTLSCEYVTRDALMQVVDSPAVATTTEMTVTPAGISDLRHNYGQPDFTHTGDPFLDWMEVKHPADAEAVSCCAGATAEESIARGELRAEFAQEWATYLEAIGCDYRQYSFSVVAGGDIVETC